MQIIYTIGYSSWNDMRDATKSFDATHIGINQYGKISFIKIGPYTLYMGYTMVDGECLLSGMKMVRGGLSYNFIRMWNGGEVRAMQNRANEFFSKTLSIEHVTYGTSDCDNLQVLANQFGLRWATRPAKVDMMSPTEIEQLLNTNTGFQKGKRIVFQHNGLTYSDYSTAQEAAKHGYIPPNGYDKCMPADEFLLHFYKYMRIDYI